MTISAVLDLRGGHSWDPAKAALDAFRWPQSPHVASWHPLGHKTTSLVPRASADEGTPVVTPFDIDVIAGGIRRRSRKYKGSVFQVGGTSGLQPGDVVISPIADSPALFMTSALSGSLVSGRFVVLRPQDRLHGLWIWAVLSSESGQTLRALTSASALGSERPGHSSLLGAPIPWPTHRRLEAVAANLEGVERGTHHPDEASEETWWTTTNLREVEWSVALATPRPELLEKGVPLREYCERIEQGRRVMPGMIVDFPHDRSIPLVDTSALRNGRPGRWVLPGHDVRTIVLPGDLLVAANGTRSYATVATELSVANQGIMVLRLKQDSPGEALARFLNGQAGHGLRQILSTGTTGHHLTRRNLERLPVAPAELDAFERVAPDLTLAALLEQLLWT